MVVLDSMIDSAAVDGLRFTPGLAPPDLGVVLARSSYENASVNHVRVLVYRLLSAVRLGAELPAVLADLIRPPRTVVGTGSLSHRAAQLSAGPRTVCVVGAGVAGLSIARELERVGHRVVVLESAPEVAGKADSVEIDGRAFDLGAHACSTRYHNFARLALEMGVPTEDMAKTQVYNIAAGTFGSQSAAFYQPETFGRYAELRATEFPQIARPGLAHSARALARPAGDWLAGHGLQSLAESLGTVYTAAGYGYMTGVLPALYLAKFTETMALVPPQSELLGHTTEFTVVGGFKALCEKVAAQLADVRCGVTITGIERDPNAITGGVRVHTDGGEIVADDVVLTAPLDQLVPVLDASDEECDIAARVRSIDYSTIVVSASGLPRSGLFLVEDYIGRPTEPGHAVAFYHRYPDCDEYSFYCYGTPDLDDEDIIALLRADIEGMGGTVSAVHAQHRWSYMPHFGSEDLAAGIFDRLEALQGQRHTYYAGSLVAFELVECVVAHGRALVADHFGGTPEDGDLPPEDLAAEASPERGSGLGSPSEDELRAWLVKHIAAELRVAQDLVSPEARLDSFELESISVATLLSMLSDRLEFRVPPTLFLEHSSITALARHLTDGADPDAEAGDVSAPPAGRSSELLLRLSGPRPFFCVGGMMGAAYYLLQTARDIGSPRPFYGLRAPGYDGGDPLDTVAEQAARYLEAVTAVQPEGPYLLGGHSYGGVVAYEMGCQLRAAGQQVSQIVLLDTYLLLPDQPLPSRDDHAAMEELLTMSLLGSPSRGADAVATLASSADGELRERLEWYLGLSAALPIAKRDEYIANMLAVYQANRENISNSRLVSLMSMALPFLICDLIVERFFPNCSAISL
jgi:thioesterase domain-containing protein/predicted NAD/FAD-dependent oxidoreductase/acyl carrier protein